MKGSRGGGAPYYLRTPLGYHGAPGPAPRKEGGEGQEEEGGLRAALRVGRGMIKKGSLRWPLRRLLP